MSKFIPSDEQWEKMKRHIKGDNYKKEDFFVFETLAVGDKIVPNRYMKLMPDLLETMREDAEKGVSLMLNHNWSQLGVQSIPIGKVFDGRIDTSSQEGETTTLYTTQYILRDDSKVDGYSKNDIIKLIESGILADTSVGWGTTRDSYKCSICGNSIYDYRKCEHIPGRKYIVDEETNEVKECIIHAHSPKEKHAGNNVLMENSVVFDGAYPNAVIQSAIGEEIDTPNGKLKYLNGKEDLSEKDIIFGYATGGTINLMYKPTLGKGGLENMEENQENEVTELETEVTETNASEVNEETVVENPAENPAENNETVETQDVEVENTQTQEVEAEEVDADAEILARFGNICENVEDLVQLAKEGLEHRNEVISSVLNSGVRSMGNSFNKDVFAKTFSNMQTKDIEQMGKVWEEQVNNNFSKEKVSKQEFSNKEESPIKIDKKQFKTSNY
jgi:hypothetical protein